MNTKKVKVSEAILNKLYKLGIEYIFLIPGTQISPFLNELFEDKNNKYPKPIIANHELSAGLMATGYARASGKIGVAVSIGGPGATYMIGSAATAKADNVPVLFITGNIPENISGKGEFQDAGSDGSNDCSIYQKTIGNTFLCNKEEDLFKLSDLLENAFDNMNPIHVQIPYNFFDDKILVGKENSENYQKESKTPGFESFVPERTVLLIGYKALNKLDRDKLIRFVQKTKIALVTDIKSRGIVPEDRPEAIGYIGAFCCKKALEVFDNQSGLKAKNVIVSGIDEKLKKRFSSCFQKNTREITPEFLHSWMDFVDTNPTVTEKNISWLNELKKIPRVKPQMPANDYNFRYFDLINIVETTMPDDTVYCFDSGQIRIAGNLFLTSRFPRSILQSDNFAPMGFGICASIGAQLANPNKKVVTLMGDGAMRMHGIEIATSARYKLPIIYILCDNQSYLSVKGSGKANGLPEVDWLSYVSAFGIKAYKPDNKEMFSKLLNDAIKLNEPVFFWLTMPGLVSDELGKNKNLIINNWYSEI